MIALRFAYVSRKPPKLRFLSEYLHNDVICSQDVTTHNKIINVHSKSGDLFSAQKLFDQMPHKDVVSWNSIMAAHAHEGYHDRVLQMFSEMHCSGLNPSPTTLSTVLSSCGRLKAMCQGKQAHCLSVKLSFAGNVYVGTSLVTMYAWCHACNHLVRVFDDIDQANLASWNALISGYVLNRFVDDARSVFERMPCRNVVSWTSLINGYVEIGNIRSAVELFDLMPVKNCVSWAVMLGGFASDGKFEEAIYLFTRMIYEGVRVNAVSLIKVITACSGLKNPKQGRKIHGCVIKLGFRFCESVEASLVSMYCKCLSAEEAKLEFDKMEAKFVGSWNSLLGGYISDDKIHEARQLFDSMISKDKISWNSMIAGYLKCKRVVDAFSLFSEMPEPTCETITILMSSMIEHGKLAEAYKLVDMLPQADVMALTTLIYGYMKEGLLENAYNVFTTMPERNVVTYNVMVVGLLQHQKVREAHKLFYESPERDLNSWNALIVGFVQNGLYGEAFTYYKKMIVSYTCSSKLVLASLLRASARLSSLVNGEQIHNISIKLGLDSCLIVRNSLINMYGKCGKMLLAKSVFLSMDDSDVVTWNAMTCGYAYNGLGQDAIVMFENMKRTNIKPDNITFLAVLTACSHRCLLQEAQRYFSSMRHDYGITPSLAHYACMVDLLCRMGMVELAERLICSMPQKPDSAVWTSLLSGCKSFCNLDVAEHAAQELLLWMPKDPVPYLHLLDIYTSFGRWEDMEKLRTQTYTIRTKSSPASSWIETL